MYYAILRKTIIFIHSNNSLQSGCRFITTKVTKKESTGSGSDARPSPLSIHPAFFWEIFSPSLKNTLLPRRILPQNLVPQHRQRPTCPPHLHTNFMFQTS
jgi:hypothetical protein